MRLSLMPTLRSLAIAAALAGSCGILSAATEAERREHLAAIKSLIDDSLRLPAERAIAAFQAAGYPDSQWHHKAARLLFADTFRAIAPAAKRAELEDEFKRLKAEIDQARKAKTLPKSVDVEMGSSQEGVAGVIRLATDVRNHLRLDEPPQTAISAARLGVVNRNLQALMQLAKSEFASGVAKVDANKAKEDKIWEMAEKDQPAAELEALQLRMEAVQPLYIAHIVLRDLSSRGSEYGIDPAPVNEFWKALLGEHKERLKQWAWEHGDRHPMFGLYLAAVLGEGVRQKVANYSYEEVNAAALKTIDDIDANIGGWRDPKMREAGKVAQIKLWNQLIRWHAELGSDAALAAGHGLWQEFLKKQKEDAKNLGLTQAGREGERAQSLGQLYISAAALLKARGDSTGANGLLAEVEASRGPASGAAGAWLRRIPAGATAPWEEQPSLTSPERAVQIAKSYLAQSNDAPKPQQREFLMNAAISLRSGILGLSSPEYESQFVEFGPQVYRYYALALNKLEMPYHATLAAHEGMRAVGGYLASAKRNPWQNADRSWNKEGQHVKFLAEAALAYASVLNGKARNSATQRLATDLVALVGKIDEKLTGENADWQVIAQAYNDGLYESAIDAARKHSEKWKPSKPEVFYKAFDFIVNCRLAIFEKLVKANNRTKADQVMSEVMDSVAKMQPYAQDQAKAKGKSPEELAAIKRTLATCVTAKVWMLIKDQQFEEVIREVGEKIATNPPDDPELAARLMKNVAIAAHGYQKAVVTDPQKVADIPALLAIWPSLERAETAFRKVQARSDGVGLITSGRALAATFQMVAQQAEKLAASKPDQADKLTPIADSAKRRFAMLLEPSLDAKAEPRVVLGVAHTLFEVGEKARAARLFELYKTTLEADQRVQAYLKDPAGVVDGYAAVITSRQETRDDWKEIRDLLVDAPDLLEKISKLQKEDGLGEQRVDFAKAGVKLRGLQKKLDELRKFNPEAIKAISDKVEELRDLAQKLSFQVMVDADLAEHYRETGEATKAIAIYERLYKGYDPLNTSYAAGYVEGVLQAIRSEASVPSAESLKFARSIASGIVNKAANDARQRDTFWTAYIQVMEISAALGGNELKVIEDSLRFARVNKSTPADDLVGPRVPGDDPRVKRCRNLLARQLGERFLTIYKHAATEKPPFKVVEVAAADGRSVAVFVDSNVNVKWELRNVPGEAGEDDVQIIIDPANPPAPKAEAPATPAPTPPSAPQAKPAGAKP